MVFKITRTSTYKDEGWIDIETIDELMAFIKREGDYSIIISAPNEKYEYSRQARIEIYDDYRE